MNGADFQGTNVQARKGPGCRDFKSRNLDWVALAGTGTTVVATLLILAILLLIIGSIVVRGMPHISWRFVSTGTASDMFDVTRAGIFPMIFGTAARVLIMTALVMPAG